MGLALLILLIVALAVPAAMGGSRPATLLLWLGGSLLWLIWAGLLSVVAAVMLGMAGLGDDYLIPAGTTLGAGAALLITYMGLKARREQESRR